MQEIILGRQLLKALAVALYDIVCQDVLETREDEKLTAWQIKAKVVFWTGKKLPKRTEEEMLQLMIKTRIFF